VAVIERKFFQASLWCLSGAALSTLGLMHSYRWNPGDTVIALAPAWPWAAGYTIMAGVFFSAKWLTVEGLESASE